MRDLKIRNYPVEAIVTAVDPLDKERVNKRLDVDQFGTSKKLLNPCGFPMNDIMIFETAQSDSVARSILQRISVNKETGAINDERTIDEHFADLCPAGWSSPAEYVRYQKMVAENYYNRLQSKKAAADAAKRLAEQTAIEDAKKVQSVNVNPE